MGFTMVQIDCSEQSCAGHRERGNCHARGILRGTTYNAFGSSLLRQIPFPPAAPGWRGFASQTYLWPRIDIVLVFIAAPPDHPAAVCRPAGVMRTFIARLSTYEGVVKSMENLIVLVQNLSMTIYLFLAASPNGLIGEIFISGSKFWFNTDVRCRYRKELTEKRKTKQNAYVLPNSRASRDDQKPSCGMDIHFH